MYDNYYVFLFLLIEGFQLEVFRSPGSHLDVHIYEHEEILDTARNLPIPKGQRRIQIWNKSTSH